MGLSFLYYHYESMQANGDVHGVKWMSIGNDRMVKIVFSYSIHSYVLFN